MLAELHDPAAEPNSAIPNVDRIISIPAWCEAVGISQSTGWRMVAAGTAPRITRLSTRRIGIRVRDYQAWADARRENKQEKKAS